MNKQVGDGDKNGSILTKTQQQSLVGSCFCTTGCNDIAIWHPGNIFFRFCEPVSGFNCTLKKKPPDQQDMYTEQPCAACIHWQGKITWLHVFAFSG